MMKLSEKLFAKVVAEWDKATEHPFVTAMADGTLEADRFKAYMLQDYYYLTDYTEILAAIRAQAENAKLRDFLDEMIRAVQYETANVHIPNMAQLGITEADMQHTGKTPACAEYLQYLKSTAQEGTIRGLAALLQCSWSYAYIARTVRDRYAAQVGGSAYLGWFETYTSAEYTGANQAWIDLLDEETQGISSEETEQLCSIFQRCAHYENSFWDCFLTSV